LTIHLQSQTKPGEYKKITLPNGWSLSPAGSQVPLGDLPLNIAISADLKYAAVTNNGQSTQIRAAHQDSGPENYSTPIFRENPGWAWPSAMTAKAFMFQEETTTGFSALSSGTKNWFAATPLNSENPGQKKFPLQASRWMKPVTVYMQ